nr:RHS repeat-associated core domain-containing protein [Burkholderia cepacia]
MWGNVQAAAPALAHAPRPQNLRFQGQYLDRETGLHYNTFRFYDPDIGRFINPDPIGLMGGVNLYRYAPNPIAWIDPWGLSCGSTKEEPTTRVRHYTIERDLMRYAKAV